MWTSRHHVTRNAGIVHKIAQMNLPLFFLSLFSLTNLNTKLVLHAILEHLRGFWRHANPLCWNAKPVTLFVQKRPQDCFRWCATLKMPCHERYPWHPNCRGRTAQTLPLCAGLSGTKRAIVRTYLQWGFAFRVGTTRYVDITSLLLAFGARSTEIRPVLLWAGNSILQEKIGCNQVEEQPSRWWNCNNAVSIGWLFLMTTNNGTHVSSTPNHDLTIALFQTSSAKHCFAPGLNIWRSDLRKTGFSLDSVFPSTEDKR